MKPVCVLQLLTSPSMTSNNSASGTFRNMVCLTINGIFSLANYTPLSTREGYMAMHRSSHKWNWLFKKQTHYVFRLGFHHLLKFSDILIIYLNHFPTFFCYFVYKNNKEL